MDNGVVWAEISEPIDKVLKTAAPENMALAPLSRVKAERVVWLVKGRHRPLRRSSTGCVDRLVYFCFFLFLFIFFIIINKIFEFLF